MLRAANTSLDRKEAADLLVATGSRFQSGERGCLFGTPLVTYVNQCFCKAPLLLIIEARKEGLGGVGELLLIGGAVAHIIGFLMHTVDDIDGAFLLGETTVHEN